MHCPTANEVGCVIGAEDLGASHGVWAKTRFFQKGPYLCATTYMVAAGNPKVFTLKVDLRPLMRAAARIHRGLHQQAIVSGEATVGWSLKKMWRGVKKTAKKLGRNKLVRGVARATKGVVRVSKGVIKSKITGAVGAVLTVFPPTAALGAAVTAGYVAANAAVKALEKGEKAVRTAGKAASDIRRGYKAASSLVKGVRRTSRAVRAGLKGRAGIKARLSASARARIARKARKLPKSKRRSMVSRLKATMAKRRAAAVRLAKRASKSRAVRRRRTRKPKARSALAMAHARRAALAKKRASARARKAALARLRAARKKKGAAARARLRAKMAAVAKARRIKARLKKPAVKVQLAQAVERGNKAKHVLSSIAHRAKYGQGLEKLDAQKSAAIVNLVAQNRSRLRGMAEQNAGGLPALLIDRRGRIKPGRFRAVAVPPGARPDVLYTGPSKQPQTGRFAQVAGHPPIGCGDRPCRNC